jgi:hypothetical protein
MVGHGIQMATDTFEPTDTSRWSRIGSVLLHEFRGVVPPDQIGPCRFGRLGMWVMVRCPRDLASFQAGGIWDPGARQWFIEPRRIGPVVRALRRQADPQFRQAGIDLDEG